MKKNLLMTRLKNLVKKESGIEYQYHLCIYVNTEHSCYAPLSNKFMYRYAKDTNDFTGGAE